MMRRRRRRTPTPIQAFKRINMTKIRNKKMMRLIKTRRITMMTIKMMKMKTANNKS